MLFFFLNVNVSGNSNVGRDGGGSGAYKNILEVSTHSVLLILLGLEKHLVIKIK